MSKEINKSAIIISAVAGALVMLALWWLSGYNFDKRDCHAVECAVMTLFCSGVGGLIAWGTQQ